MASSAASRLAAWLERKGVTLAEFGKKIGTTKASVHYWKEGQRTPEAFYAAKIERETGIPVSAWPRRSR